ncbi:hypothetical protein [Jiella pacifica]|mgnify:CR=1 FL=1|uniref:Uncharacterized protein n=1 Tax=Jiella pacifica TaxID=2696469 RepID=A0A6N9SYA9_9HYPH|nr:hypothetical protein [Jiella pacifica]NDW04083.1 hypothetical protein [Jiella pacifica]
MSKRFSASAEGVKVSPPGFDVDTTQEYLLLFSSDRYALSGALRGSFFVEEGEWDDGWPTKTFLIDLPPGSGALISWTWTVKADTLAPLGASGASLFQDDITNQLVCTIQRGSTEKIFHYLIYRNRT